MTLTTIGSLISCSISQATTTSSRPGSDSTPPRRPAPPVRAFKDAIDAVFVTHDYVGYRSAYDYATNIDTVLDSLDALLGDGHAEAVIEQAEHALVRVEDAVGYVDDSDGWGAAGSAAVATPVLMSVAVVSMLVGLSNTVSASPVTRCSRRRRHMTARPPISANS